MFSRGIWSGLIYINIYKMLDYININKKIQANKTKSTYYRYSDAVVVDFKDIMNVFPNILAKN